MDACTVMKREKRHNASGISNEGMQFLAMFFFRSAITISTVGTYPRLAATRLVYNACVSAVTTHLAFFSVRVLNPGSTSRSPVALYLTLHGSELYVYHHGQQAGARNRWICTHTCTSTILVQCSKCKATKTEFLSFWLISFQPIIFRAGQLHFHIQQTLLCKYCGVNLISTCEQSLATCKQITVKSSFFNHNSHQECNSKFKFML